MRPTPWDSTPRPSPAPPADLAGVRLQHPRTIRMAVVLPAPLGPTKPNSCPSRTPNGRVVEGHHLAVATGQSP
jgi:hypothetical protein